MVQQGKIRFIHSAVPVKKKVVTHMAVTMVDLADIVDLVAMVTVEEAVDTVEVVVDIAEEVVMTIAEAGTVGEVVLDIVVVVIVVEAEVTVAEEDMDTVLLVVIIVGEVVMDTVVVVIVAEAEVIVEVEVEGMGIVGEEITENVMTATTMEAMILDTNHPGNLGLMDIRHQTSSVNTKRKLFMLLKLNINLRRNASRSSLRVVKRNMRQGKA